MNLMQPKLVEIDGKKFKIHKLPALAGREIMSKYPTSALPKIGDYAVNEETMLKLMAFVTFPLGDGYHALESRELIDNNVPSWESLAKLEMAMIEYNCSFFQNGRVSNFLEDIVQNLPQLITQILTGSLGRLSPTDKPL